MLKKAFILPGTILLSLLGIWILIHFYAPAALAKLQKSSLPSLTLPATFTNSEVQLHNTTSSCWTIIEDQVYDVTSFIDEHPGGERITAACGIDATTLFKQDFPHNPQGEATLKDYFIGNLQK